MAETLRPKAPGEVIRYTWKPKTYGYLANIALDATGVTITRSGVAGDEAFFYASGGTLGSTATVTLTVTTTDGETLSETFSIPIRAKAAALGVRVADVLAYALRPIVGIAGAPTAAEQTDARENLDMLLAEWAAQGADLGVRLPTQESDTLALSDSYALAVKANLRVRLCEAYGKPLTAMDVLAARRGEILIKFNNLPDSRAGVYY